MSSVLRVLLIAILALPLAAFFGFVGWHKAFSPLAELARHHSWTVFLPEWLGRAIGWSEMACAAALVASLHPALRRSGLVGALLLVANQVLAALVHLANGEGAAVPQNAVLIAALAALAMLFDRSRRERLP